MTLTIELPDTLASQLPGLPRADLQKWVTDAFLREVDTLTDDKQGADFDPEIVAALQKVMAIGLDDSVTISLADYAKKVGVVL